MDEDALRCLALSGDAQAFGRLVRTHQRRLVRFAERMLGNADAAEDATQEAFLRLWRGRARYQDHGNLTYLLLRIVRNICLDYCRSAHSTPPLPEEQAQVTRPAPELERGVQARALATAVRQAVLALPEPQRVVFVLSQYEGLAYREIADVLGCPVGTVASRKYQAVETLRRRLAPWMEEERR